MAWGCSVREMLARVNSAELTELAALWRIDPWGGIRGDWHAATVAAAVVNMLRGDGKSSDPSEFVPQWGRAETAAERWARRAREFAAMAG